MPSRYQDRTLDEKFYLTDDGLQFDKSILWLDSKKNGKLSFLSSAASVRERHETQVIVTEETYQLLKLYNPRLKALICQYNRPFSIGRYNLELLPSGSVLGGASLYIDTGQEKILYAPMISDSKVPLARTAQCKPVDYLVLRVDYYDSFRSNLSRKKELGRFVSCVKSCLYEKKIPIILSPLLHTASEICDLLTQQGLKLIVHKHIFDINKVYESFGHNLGDYQLLSMEKDCQDSVIILPKSYRSQKLLLFAKNRQFLFINDKLDPSYAHNNENTFDVPLPDIGANLIKIIKELKPKKTYLLGPYANKLMSASRLSDEHLEVIHPFNQKPLL